MIKLLYDNGYILDKHIISSKIERTINSSYFLEFDMPLSSDLSNIIKENMEIEASIPNNQTDIFRVRLIRKNLDTIYFYCTQVFFSLEDNFIEDTNIVSKDGLGAILQIGNNTQYPHKFNFYSDIGTTNNARMVRKNVVSAILGDEDNTFISRWGGELDIHKYNVKMLTKLGTDRGVTIEYKKNLTGFEGTIDYSAYYTRCMPQGYDGLFLDEKYVDSEHIDINHPIIRVVEFPDIKVKKNDEDDGYVTEDEAKQALRDAAKELYKQGADIPTANYEVNFIELSSTEEYKNYSILESIWLGDTVTVKHDNFNIKSRCVNYSFDPIVKKYNSITLGEASNGIVEESENIKTEINKVVNNVKNDYAQYLDVAIKEATDLINKGLGGHAYKTRNEFLILDTEDIMTAKKVLRINQNGIGFSSTGYNGSYSTAITADGKLVISEATASKFTASLIQSGLLRSLNGVSWINLDNGTFNFADKIKYDGEKFGIELGDISVNLVNNGSFNNGIEGWNKVNITIGTPTFYNNERNWCNFYTTFSAGERYGENIFDILPNKVYNFSMLLAQYSTSKTFYRIRVETKNKNSDAWTVIKEFTGNTSATISKPEQLSYSFKSASTVEKCRIWIGKLDGETFDIYVSDLFMGTGTIYARKSEFEILDTKISSKVSEDDFGTLVEQNAHAVKIAWNNNSKYVQFESGGLAIYNGAVNESQKRAFFDERGNHFWRDGYYVGKIGTNQYADNTAIKGITFDLESQGGYMTWAVNKTSANSTYTMIWSYANKTIGNYEAGKLHAGCDIDMHNHTLRNVKFEGGGITGTMNFVQISGMNSNGTASNWYNNCKLQFQNGILISGTWG